MNVRTEVSGIGREIWPKDALSQPSSKVRQMIWSVFDMATLAGLWHMIAGIIAEDDGQRLKEKAWRT
jgi:hypothetical protein